MQGRHQQDAAALALELAPGTWIDLDPATFEQGPFLIGSPTFSMLMPKDPSQAITVSTMVDTVMAEGFLAEVEAVEAQVKDAVDVTAGIQVRSPGELSESGPTYSEAIFSSDSDPALRTAWGGLAEEFGPLDDSGIGVSVLVSTTRNVEFPAGSATLSTQPFDLSVEVHDQLSDCVLADPRVAEVADAVAERLRATEFAFQFSATACGREFMDDERPRN